MANLTPFVFDCANELHKHVTFPISRFSRTKSLQQTLERIKTLLLLAIEIMDEMNGQNTIQQTNYPIIEGKNQEWVNLISALSWQRGYLQGIQAHST